MEAFFDAFLLDVRALNDAESQLRTSNTTVVPASVRSTLTTLYDKYKVNPNNDMMVEVANAPVFNNATSTIHWIAGFWQSIRAVSDGDFSKLSLAMAVLRTNLPTNPRASIVDLINAGLASVIPGVVPAARNAQKILETWKVRYPNGVSAISLAPQKGQFPVMLTLRDAVEKWIWYCNPERFDEGLFLSASATTPMDRFVDVVDNKGMQTTSVWNVGIALAAHKQSAVVAGPKTIFPTWWIGSNAVPGAFAPYRVATLNALVKPELTHTNTGEYQSGNNNILEAMYSRCIVTIGIGRQAFPRPLAYINATPGLAYLPTGKTFYVARMTVEARRASNGQVISTHTSYPATARAVEGWTFHCDSDDEVELWVTAFDTRGTAGGVYAGPPSVSAVNGEVDVYTCSMDLVWTQATGIDVLRRVVDAVADGVTEMATPNLGWADDVNVMSSALYSYNFYLGTRGAVTITNQLAARYQIIRRALDTKAAWGEEVYQLAWWFSRDPSITSETAAALYRVFYDISTFQLRAMLVDGGFHQYLLGI